MPSGIRARNKILGPSIAARVMAFLDPPVPLRGGAAFPQLTDRELEVLDLVAQHVRNPQIAARLGVSTKTACNHVSNILGKLPVGDRTQAIMLARDAGMG